MPNSDSDDDGLDYLEFDGEDDGDGEGEGEPEEELPDALVADDVTEDGDVCLFHFYDSDQAQ